jgi:hypothetical protein
MLTKERPGGMYRLSAYYAARCAADLPIEILNTLLFVTVVYFFGGLRLTAAAFFGNLFGMLLIVLVAQVGQSCWWRMWVSSTVWQAGPAS